MADVYEKDLAQKSSVTNNDFIRVVGTDNVSYKNKLIDIKYFMGLQGYGTYDNTIYTELSDCSYAGIGNFIKSAVNETDFYKNRWISTRVANTGSSVTPFGTSSFSILFNCSSTLYGWAILMSDSPSTSFIVGRLSSGTWTWLDVWGNINSLNSKTTPISTTLTGCGKPWNFYKFGRLVLVEAPDDIASANSGFTTLGTLPEEYRPARQVYFGVANDNVKRFLAVGTDGVVRFYTGTAITSAANGGVSGTYISAN